MAQPQQTFTQWARNYNSSSYRRSNHSDLFKDGFLWKIVVLIGLGYLVWADKFSITLSLNDQEIAGKNVKTSLLTLLDDASEPLPELKDFKLTEGKHNKKVNATVPSKSDVTTKPAAAVDPDKRRRMASYVERFAPVAKAEMNKFGIPASIILAQGLLESNAGASGLAKQANNHFGMKCFSQKCKKGHCLNYSDDTHKDFFVKYANVWGSYRQHSEMLKNKQRYAHLFSTRDYRKWATGLAKAGYATDKQYGEKLIALIQELQLDRFDKP